jgi:hypothetical protein
MFKWLLKKLGINTGMKTNGVVLTDARGYTFFRPSDRPDITMGIVKTRS